MNFEIESESLRAITKNAGRISIISGERIVDELNNYFLFTNEYFSKHTNAMNKLLTGKEKFFINNLFIQLKTLNLNLIISILFPKKFKFINFICTIR